MLAVVPRATTGIGGKCQLINSLLYLYSLEQSLFLSLSLSLSLSLLCFFFLIKHRDGCQATIVCVVPYVPILFSDGLVLW